jgi:hypothetical protein
MTHRMLVSLAIALALSGCDGGDDDVDAGRDAGSMADAGGDGEDAGSDAGGEEDAGTDAGPLSDDAGTPMVVINEVSPTDLDFNAFDWIELFNAGDGTADISGWDIVDDGATSTPYTFPAGTTIAPGAYLVIDQSDTFDFELGASNEGVHLRDEGDVVVNETMWTNVTNPSSWGRFPNGTGDFSLRATKTQGAANE